jgi:putative spermidine/putrescine transport system permease protein
MVLLALLFVGLFGGLLQAFGYIPEYRLYQLTPQYFVQVLQSPQLLQSIGISLYVAVVSTIVATILAVLLAHALVVTGKDRGVAFTLIKFPIFFPWMITALLAMDMLGGGGILANLFRALGVPALAELVGEILYAPHCLGIIFAFIWATTPFICFFVITVMSNISKSLGEAAVNLGANTRQTLTGVTLPLCMPAIKSVFLITLVSLFANYEIPLLLGMTIPRGLPVEIYYELANYPIAQRPAVMALSMLMLVVSLLLVLVFTLLFNQSRGIKTTKSSVANKACEPNQTTEGSEA